MTVNLLLAGGEADTGASDTSPTVTGSTLSAGFLASSVGNALVATGTNVGTALALTNQINNFATVASGTGAVLPTVASVGVGVIVIVNNAGADTLKVYGGASDTIDGVAAATGVSLATTHRCMFISVAPATYISALMGATSD